MSQKKEYENYIEEVELIMTETITKLYGSKIPAHVIFRSLCLLAYAFIDPEETPTIEERFDIFQAELRVIKKGFKDKIYE